MTDMLHRRAVLAAAGATSVMTLAGVVSAAPPAHGTLIELPQVRSKYVVPRNVTIWLPENYEGGRERFPVLYMHDGQNLFDDDRANFGVEWGVDEHLSELAADRRARAAIVVGVWSTSRRFREYAPAGMVALLPDGLRARVEQSYGGAPLSNEYVRFLVEELKPMVDATYRTLAGRADTFVMGSSMGGLVSLYALCRSPQVFGGAACLSTHWPLLPIDFDKGPRSPRPWQNDLIAASTRYLARALPAPGAHRLYFDHGDQHLDQLYQPYQQAVDRTLMRTGYVRGSDFVSRVYPGTSHNEGAWRSRSREPLLYLLHR